MTEATVAQDVSTAIKATSNNHTKRWNPKQPHTPQLEIWTSRVRGHGPRAKNKWFTQETLSVQSTLNINPLHQCRPHDDTRDAFKGNDEWYLTFARRLKPDQQKQTKVIRKMKETRKVINTVDTVTNTPSAAIASLGKKVVSQLMSKKTKCRFQRHAPSAS
jgi:hypothetical protein